MKNFLSQIFKEDSPLRFSFDNDNSLAAIINESGGALMMIGFLILGVLSVIMSRRLYPPDKYRTLSTLTFGWFLIFASFVRGMELLAYWHNFGMIRGILKIIAGLFALYSISLLPIVVRDSLKYKGLMELKDSLDKTKQKLEHLEILNEQNKANDTITRDS